MCGCEVAEGVWDTIEVFGTVCNLNSKDENNGDDGVEAYPSIKEIFANSNNLKQ